MLLLLQCKGVSDAALHVQSGSIARSCALMLLESCMEAASAAGVSRARCARRSPLATMLTAYGACIFVVVPDRNRIDVR